MPPAAIIGRTITIRAIPFEVIGVLPDYLPSDHESLGYAAHLVWRNPSFSDHPAIRTAQRTGDLPAAVRVATVQYQQRRIKSFEEFATQIEYFVDIAADYRSDFVVFPELITLQLLSIENKPLSPSDSIRTLTKYTKQYRDLMHKLEEAPLTGLDTPMPEALTVMTARRLGIVGRHRGDAAGFGGHGLAARPIFTLIGRRVRTPQLLPEAL